MSDQQTPDQEQQPQASVLPDPLKGKSADEIYKILQAEHIKEMAEKEAELRMQAARAATPPAPQQPQNQPEPSSSFGFVPPMQPSSDQPSMLEDPERFLDAQFNRRMGPLVNAFTQSQRETARALAMQAIPKDEWDEFGKEIEAVVQGMHPTVQIQPKAYELAYKLVRGEHLDKIADRRAEKKAEEIARRVLGEMGIDNAQFPQSTQGQQPQRVSLFQGPVGVPTVSTPAGNINPRGAARSRLSEEERSVADKFHMSEDEYIKYRDMNTDIVSELTRSRK